MVDDVCGFPAFSNGLTNANSTNLTEFLSWAQVLVSIHHVLGSMLLDHVSKMVVEEISPTPVVYHILLLKMFMTYH